MAVPGMSYLSSSRKSGKKSSKGKVNRSPVWVNPLTLESQEEKGEGLIYFPSTLERDVYLHFRFNGIEGFEIHQKIEILPEPNQDFWECDFYFPKDRLIVEAKGEWINNKSNKADKALFLLKMKLALNKGYRIILVNSKPFKLAEFDVLTYKVLQNGDVT